MKTTLDLPDDLLRAIKVRAAREDRKLKDLISELLRKGLSSEETSAPRGRVRLPLVQCEHPAAPGAELTPEKVAALLDEDEGHPTDSC